MRYLYYPGCTLKDKAKKMEDSAIISAKLLGIDLVEIEDWQCCGAVFPLSEDELITLLSPARTLKKAGDEPLVTLCSACHHVLKRTRERLGKDPVVLKKINDFLESPDNTLPRGRILHFLELLRDDYGFDCLSEKVKNPLDGVKVASYYGCMLLRPAGVMQFDDPENPSVMEDFTRALGAEPIIYPYRTECCGGYLSVTNKDVAAETAERIVGGARRAGADYIATACPMCVYNLNKALEKEKTITSIKVVYFTELLATALGVEEPVEVNL